METEPQREPKAVIPLSGGRLTPGIVRVGNTVRRPAKGNAAFVHDLEDQGFPFASRFLGRDEPGKKSLIELAYQVAEAYGLPLWCQDEAGPYATRPQPGASWQRERHAKLQPHEYVRKGGAKLMTLFRSATGEVRAKGVPSVTNAVLHLWLQEQLLELLEIMDLEKTEAQEPAPSLSWARLSIFLS
jgi:hypothetical protein